MKRTEEYQERNARQQRERRNPIRRLKEAIAGGRRAYYGLPPEKQADIHATAKQMFELGVDFATAEKAERTDTRGFVYVITNPAWREHVKIGRAFNPRSRLAGYQTGTPFRDYKLEYAVYFKDCYFAEREIHARLSPVRVEGEWFVIPVSYAIWHINQLREVL